MQGKNCVNFLIAFMDEMKQCLTKLEVMAHQRSQASPPICTSLIQGQGVLQGVGQVWTLALEEVMWGRELTPQATEVL